MIGIYKITSPEGKVYIGQSRNIKKRFAQYKSIKSSRSQTGLHASFKKHGISGHSFEVICECSPNELNTLERFYQEEYKVIDDSKGLNRCYVNTETKRLVYQRRPSKIRLKTGNYDALKALQDSGDLEGLVDSHFIFRSVIKKLEVYAFFVKTLESARGRLEAINITCDQFKICRSSVFTLIKGLE